MKAKYYFPDSLSKRRWIAFQFLTKCLHLWIILSNKTSFSDGTFWGNSFHRILFLCLKKWNSARAFFYCIFLICCSCGYSWEGQKKPVQNVIIWKSDVVLSWPCRIPMVLCSGDAAVLFFLWSHYCVFLLCLRRVFWDVLMKETIQGEGGGITLQAIQVLLLFHSPQSAVCWESSTVWGIIESAGA